MPKLAVQTRVIFLRVCISYVYSSLRLCILHGYARLRLCVSRMALLPSLHASKHKEHVFVHTSHIKNKRCIAARGIAAIFSIFKQLHAHN